MTNPLHDAAMAAKRFHDAALAALDHGDPDGFIPGEYDLKRLLEKLAQERRKNTFERTLAVFLGEPIPPTRQP